VFLTLHFNIDG